MSIKFLVWGGDFGVWGGGRCRFYFYGRRDFSEINEDFWVSLFSATALFLYPLTNVVQRLRSLGKSRKKAGEIQKESRRNPN